MGWAYKFIVGIGILAASTMMSCGGGGGGTSGISGSVDALQVAEKVSVVDASTSSASASISKVLLSSALSKAFPADSDYTKDVTQVYIAERTTDAFDIINEILCAVAQTQYDEMINDGDYIAQIDLNQCEQEQDSAASSGQSSTNQSSSSTMPDYEEWTANSSRASSSSPQIIKFWIHEEASAHDPAKLIMIKATITESVSTTNPYGIFTANFLAYPEVNGVANTSSAFFKGLLKAEKDSTGKVLLKFVVSGSFSGDGQEFSFSEKAVLDRNADGTSGSGTAEVNDSFAGKSKSFGFDIAFNQDNFKRVDSSTGEEVCLDRDSFDESAWRYGMYTSAGARVNRNSGFPIQFTSSGTDYNGWVGYWGVWVPDDVTIPNGATVNKMTYSSGGSTKTPYTVVQKGGKLVKHTKKTTTLGGIKNIPLDFYDQDTMFNYRVKWDGTKFVKFARQNQSSWIWENITEAELILTSMQFGELSFWAQSIGGQVRVPLVCTYDENTMKNACTSPTSSSEVVYFVEDIVYPGDTVPANLRCYDNCPKYDASDGVVTQENNYAPDAPAWNYTFSSASSDMILKDGAGNGLVRSAEGSGQYQWGFHSGALFEPSVANIALLACDWDPTETCGWKAWGALSEYYTWETGPNSWNQFSGLVDSTGAILRFEAPLQVAYTHSQTDSSENDHKYNGVTFFLDYNGFGELHGIPSTCVDMNIGDVVDCGDGKDEIRWVPEFTIPAGSTGTANGTTYYVKPLEMEQRMKDAPGACDALSTTHYILPDISLWEDPSLGAEPTVTDSPAVIGGVVQ